MAKRRRGRETRLTDVARDIGIIKEISEVYAGNIATGEKILTDIATLVRNESRKIIGNRPLYFDEDAADFMLGMHWDIISADEEDFAQIAQDTAESDPEFFWTEAGNKLMFSLMLYDTDYDTDPYSAVFVDFMLEPGNMAAAISWEREDNNRNYIWNRDSETWVPAEEAE